MQNASSSSSPLLQDERALCRPDDFNRFAPTKQALLCQGRSAIDVIMENQDFKRPPKKLRSSLKCCLQLPARPNAEDWMKLLPPENRA